LTNETEMQIFKIENKDKERLTIILEPWAEEYYLKKSETIELQQENSLKGYYHQVFYGNGDIQIFVEGAYSYPLILINGKITEAFNE